VEPRHHGDCVFALKWHQPTTNNIGAITPWVHGACVF